MHTSNRAADPPVIERRDLIKLCLMAAAAVGLPASVGAKIAQAAKTGLRPSVIWLHFQECTGCTESLLRSSHPDLGELILNLISLDYHETLSAAAGHQAEDVFQAAMKEKAGKYILVIEGAIPIKQDGIYCKIGGRTAVEIVKEAAAQAGAIVAIGSCASFGGIAAADPNPTGAQGAPAILEGKKVVTIPGCPPNPYNFLGTALQYAVYGTLPTLDMKGRPLFAYGRTIHEHCPRRPHFDAGRFAERFGDEAHRQAFCLYKLGCKGPQTYANCSTLRFGEVGMWPVRAGHPCVGCTEQSIAFRIPIHQTVDIPRPTPSDTIAPVQTRGEGINPMAVGAASLALGALLGAGAMASRRLNPARVPDKEEKP